jgi:hypothetical protein
VPALLARPPALAALIINGTSLPASASHVRDTRGAPLHAPGVGPGTYVLAPSQVWIYSPDPYSLDSRLLVPFQRPGSPALFARCG